MKLFFKKIKNSLIYRYRFFYFKITTFFWNLLSSLIISNARNLVAKKSLFVFVPVWGDKYIDWFFEYCFASLMQKENLPLVKEKKEIIFYFYTKGESVDYLNSSIKDNIVGFKSKVFTEDCFDDHARDTMSNYLIHIIKECIDKKALFLFAPPDSIFSNGSVGNMVALSDGKGVSVAIPNARVSVECIDKNNLNVLGSGIELVNIILECPHHSVLFSDESLDSNSTLDGVTTRKLENGMAVTHNLPPVYLCDPIKSDLYFFKRRVSFNIVDKVWPHMLFRQSRLKVITSSDIALVIEITHDDDKDPKILPNMKNNDFYKGFPPFMNYANVIVSFWRSK